MKGFQEQKESYLLTIKKVKFYLGKNLRLCDMFLNTEKKSTEFYYYH